MRNKVETVFVKREFKKFIITFGAFLFFLPVLLGEFSWIDLIVATVMLYFIVILLCRDVLFPIILINNQGVGFFKSYLSMKRKFVTFDKVQVLKEESGKVILKVEEYEFRINSEEASKVRKYFKY